MKNIAASIILDNITYVPTALKAILRLRHDKPAKFDKIKKFSKDIRDERKDIIPRLRYLCKTVIGHPQSLIDKMPNIVDRDVQGEWAIYACSMTCYAICNCIRLFPDIKDEFIGKIPELIKMVLSDEIKLYDTVAFFGEDALKSLDSNNSHMTYLSILAWMISEYRKISDDEEFDSLLKDICSALYRRMKKRPDLNLPSFPNGIVFLPDMMFTLLSLKNYGEVFDDHPEYAEILKQWVEKAKKELIDPKTGLLISMYYANGYRTPLHGSYSGLNTTCLALIDRDFGRQQYELLKKHFAKFGKYCGIKEELHDSKKLLDFNIDAGPIVMGMSPTGIAFSLGAATIFKDWKFRKGLLNSAELAGHTIKRKNLRHYKLAEILLTGEAITLAFRTIN